MPGFAAVIAATVTWNFLPMLLNVSPLAIVYSVAAAGGGSTGADGMTLVGAVVTALSGTILVGASSVADDVAFVPSFVVLVSVCRHPCINKASKPMPWTARTKKTAILTRAR